MGILIAAVLLRDLIAAWTVAGEVAGKGMNAPLESPVHAPEIQACLLGYEGAAT
jgi:hypothetical protein